MVPARFAVATHILVLLAAASGAPAEAATSVWLAARVHTNPVVVRRICGHLTRAGLLRVRRGAGGAELARPPGAITLEDVWLALHAADARPLLPLHAPAGDAAGGGATRAVLAGAFAEAEAAFRVGLRGITLHDLAQRLNAV